jgi:DNA-binding GntR family transcriptional regulator
MPDGPSTGTAPSSTVKRSSLRQQIADALRDEVLTGRLPAGRHFTVKEIAELYGVSATPVREALVDLAAQGLLDIEHHRGFRVTRFTHDDFLSLIDARAIILDSTFRRMNSGGIENCPPGALTSLRRRADAAASAARSGHLDILIGYDLRFWRELAALAGNEHICEFLDRIRAQTWVYSVPLFRGQPQLAGTFWADHVPLADAVAARDMATVQRLVDAYNAHTVALMEKLAADLRP